MDTREDSSMEPHSDTRIEKRKYIQSLIYSFCDIIGATRHELLDIETIVLTDIALGREYEEYRLISLCDEVVIYLWDGLFGPFEESSTYGYPDTFLLHSWECLQSLILIEEYDIVYDDARDFECFEEFLAARITYQYKIPSHEKRLESELARYHRYFE